MEVEIKYDGEVLARVDVIGAISPLAAAEAVRNRLDIAAIRPTTHKLDLTPHARTATSVAEVAPEPQPQPIPKRY